MLKCLLLAWGMTTAVVSFGQGQRKVNADSLYRVASGHYSAHRYEQAYVCYVLYRGLNAEKYKYPPKDSFYEKVNRRIEECVRHMMMDAHK